jgi:hypothetical protein
MMPEPTGSKQVSTKFKPGQSGNPAGRPKGSRNKLCEDFISKLYADFTEHGAQAIDTMRQEDPSGYVKVVAGLLPKEFVIDRPIEGLTDDELAAAIVELRARLTAAHDAGARSVEAGQREQIEVLPPIRETS